MMPILLVPGLLCTPEVFAPQIFALWPYGSVTIASTLIGATIAEMATAILADSPPRFALAGISMGGCICMEIMRQAPERVSKLALISTSARPYTPEQSELSRISVDRARSGQFETLLAETASAMLHPKHRNEPTLLDFNIRMGMTVGIDGFARQTDAVIGRPDSRPNLPDISVPTLILVGDSDPWTPPGRSEEMAALIPGARLVIIPDCGHASTREQPELVNRALIEWITA